MQVTSVPVEKAGVASGLVVNVEAGSKQSP
jgi:hypothetical protein